MNDLKNKPTPEEEKSAVTEASSFDRKRHIAGAIFGPLCALLVWLTPIAGLTTEVDGVMVHNVVAHKLLAIMTLVAIW